MPTAAESDGDLGVAESEKAGDGVSPSDATTERDSTPWCPKKTQAIFAQTGESMHRTAENVKTRNLSSAKRAGRTQMHRRRCLIESIVN